MPANDEIRLWSSGKRPIPPRPEFPEPYPETDEWHWYDLEFAGWDGARKDRPLSPGDSPAGKRIIAIHHLGGHPYMAGYDRGLLREAERYGMELEIFRSEWDPELEMELVAKAIRKRPDLMVICPERASDSVALFRKVHNAGIPLIASNLLPEREAFSHLLAWTGPDDWGQFRPLADRLRSHVGAHFRDPMSLKLLAGRFGMSAAYLGKVFREGNGRSFSANLNEVRIAAALRILESRKAKAKEVALAVGYSDADYFCSVFRKLTGMHPSKVELAKKDAE